MYTYRVNSFRDGRYDTYIATILRVVYIARGKAETLFIVTRYVYRRHDKLVVTEVAIQYNSIAAFTS